MPPTVTNTKLTVQPKHPSSKDTSPGRDSYSSSTGSSATTSIREVDLSQEFEILKTLAEGCFAKILLVKKQDEKLVLKAIHCELTTEGDFLREMQYHYYLSPHPNIVRSYKVPLFADNCYIYAQEYASYGDLSRFVKKGGLPESQTKLIVHQISSALDFMHGVRLVHRDLKPENILVFQPDLSVVKLSDFGHTRQEGTLVTKTTTTGLAFSPPEICHLVPQEKYYCYASSDVWQLGVILIYCLTGHLPWKTADIDCPDYCKYKEWHRRKTLRVPEPLKHLTPRFIRLIKRFLEPKCSLRSRVREVNKYLKDDWVKRGHSVEAGNSNRSLNETDQTGVTFHSLGRNERSRHRLSRSDNYTKSQFFKNLKLSGVQTEIDKRLVVQRVESWISSSSGNSSGGSSCSNSSSGCSSNQYLSQGT